MSSPSTSSSSRRRTTATTWRIRTTTTPPRCTRTPRSTCSWGPKACAPLAARGRPSPFSIDNNRQFHDVYTHVRTSLDGRLMFIDGKLGEPYAVVLIRNDPHDDAADIAGAVAAGLIVRVRADSDTV